MPSVPYAWAPSTMLFPSPSGALIPNLNLLYEKPWVLWLRAVWGCFGPFLGPLGRHIGVSWVDQPLPRSPPPFKTLYYKIWTFYLKNFGFYGLGLFGAVWGCFGLFLGPLGRHIGVSWVGQPLPRSPPSFKKLYYKIWTFYLKNFEFYGLGLFWAVLGLFFGPLGRHMRVS